ncbi:MAG: HAMP domain-containing sensor histidine kinase [Acidobacteriota bacterium]
MLRDRLTNLTAVFRRGFRRERASILLPFLIISLALGGLSWRSYQLSLRMERGANTLAVQYAGYAAEITARRVDAAVRGELTRASDDWQQAERRMASPTFVTLQEWINAHEWIVSAIYVPDADPTSSIFVSEIATPAGADSRLTREFYTSTGTVRYTYDPERLLAHLRPVIRQQPLARLDDGSLSPQPQADVTVVGGTKRAGLTRLPDGFAYVAPLGAPLTMHAIRAAVRTSYVGSGWENQRLTSLWVTLGALILTTLGAYLAWHGLKKEAETMKLRGALIANVSHELRTPLAMIRLGAETLKLSSKLKEHERQEIEEQILREVLHLSHLVENVLDIARIQHRASRAMAFTPVYPRELVTSLISTYESWIRSKGFTVTTQMDEAVEEQLWDREAVSRALLNLIDNAIKYSAGDKKIEVSLRQTAEDVVIEVSDHGVGIDSKDLTRIFDPYFRAQFSDTQTRRGAGLGLTLVHQIVGSHGGRVEVESVLGSGSTFRLLFPRVTASAPRRVIDFVQAPEAF